MNTLLFLGNLLSSSQQSSSEHLGFCLFSNPGPLGPYRYVSHGHPSSEHPAEVKLGRIIFYCLQTGIQTGHRHHVVLALTSELPLAIAPIIMQSPEARVAGPQNWRHGSFCHRSHLWPLCSGGSWELSLGLSWTLSKYSGRDRVRFICWENRVSDESESEDTWERRDQDGARAPRRQERGGGMGLGKPGESPCPSPQPHSWDCRGRRLCSVEGTWRSYCK